jgi:hypothetical protein
METLFVTRDATLKQRENTLSITVDGQSRSLPIESIGHLVLLGESRLNTRLLTLCGKHGVRISVFDYYGYCKGCFEPVDRSPAGLVKLKQAGLLLDDAKRADGCPRGRPRGRTQHGGEPSLLRVPRRLCFGGDYRNHARPGRQDIEGRQQRCPDGDRG